MASPNDHFRKNFLTGALAATPIAITAYLIYLINEYTELALSKVAGGRNIPIVGLVLALVIIYFAGMLANSIIGQFVLRRVDHLLASVPLVREIYRAWKQIALTPGGTEGTFSKVVLLPDETGRMKWLGFTSGRQVEGAEPMYCVFVPNSPNPITGRIYFVPIHECTILTMSIEEAFKVILSTGNYVPPLVPNESQFLTEPKP
jgi:uncharacterized membrane protein